MDIIRMPTVDGVFYPASPKNLKETITQLLSAVNVKSDGLIPKAIIVPHAGYTYSGAVAATAYACLKQAKNQITRVILLGPAHFYPLSGIATLEADYFKTPLGLVKVDRSAVNSIRHFSQISIVKEAHAKEHALEVQLPFLQCVLEDFSIVPLVTSFTRSQPIAEILNYLWGGKETLIVISSDLSHYHPYAEAQLIDQHTTEAILDLNADAIGVDDACGSPTIRGLLTVAAEKKLKPVLLDLRNSTDTANTSPEQVVGYGAFHFYETDVGKN